MKKIIIFLASLVLASLAFLGLQHFIPMETPTPNPTVQIDQSNEQITLEPRQTLLEETSLIDSFFNESIVGESPFPTASVPSQISHLNIADAINDYYVSQYSEVEKEANLSPVSEEDMATLQEAINNDPNLSNLSVKIDQVTMTLGGKTTYIPRLIVESTYQASIQEVPDNDVQLLTLAMTHLGNRLAMICYYDQASNQLFVYHLTNWTNPLFTYTQ